MKSRQLIPLLCAAFMAPALADTARIQPALPSLQKTVQLPYDADSIDTPSHADINEQALDMLRGGARDRDFYIAIVTNQLAMINQKIGPTMNDRLQINPENIATLRQNNQLTEIPANSIIQNSLDNVRISNLRQLDITIAGMSRLMQNQAWFQSLQTQLSRSN